MILKNAKVFYQGEFKRLDIRLEKEYIAEISECIAAGEFLDCSGKLLIPGLIDLHTHGCIGYDFSSASVNEIEMMSCFYAEHGVTSVLCTTMTMEYGSHCRAMKNLREAIERRGRGCNFLGIRTEGPFLGADKKGAHDAGFLSDIDEEKFLQLDELSGHHIRLADIDPCLPDALRFIEKYSKEKIISLAHTSCNYELGCKAVKAGASQVTHLFNAMNGLHHREPGLIGVVSDCKVHAELICDGIHIHPGVIRLVYKALADRMIMISDSMSAAGLKDGEYQLGGQKVYVYEGKAALADGTIAGSTITVYDALRNNIRFGVNVKDAILSATLQPAQAIHAEDRIGSLEAGKQADLLLVSPDFDLERVILRGTIFQ